MKMKVIKKPQSIFSRLSKNASIALRSASLVSEHFKEKNISVMSIFAGILLNEDNLATKVIEEMDLDRSEILKDLFDGKVLEITGDTSGAKLLSFSPEAQEVFRKAFDYAQRMSHVYVGTEHLMLAILSAVTFAIIGSSSPALGLAPRSFSFIHLGKDEPEFSLRTFASNSFFFIPSFISKPSSIILSKSTLLKLVFVTVAKSPSRMNLSVFSSLRLFALAFEL